MRKLRNYPTRLLGLTLALIGMASWIAISICPVAAKPRIHSECGASDEPLFRTAGFFAAGTFPVAVVAGDFNGDGKPDLAVANFGAVFFSGSVSLLLGDGMGG